MGTPFSSALATPDLELDFGATPGGLVDCAPALNRAIAWMTANQRPIHISAKTYGVASEIIIGGTYCQIKADVGATLVSLNTTSPYINSTTTPDTSIPTTSAPGPMRGCCFYTTTIINNARIENLTLKSFRFGFAHLNPWNGPVWQNCTFYACNVGVFCYQTSQNYTFLNCTNVGGTGNMHVAAATCFIQSSPYAGLDNVEMDGLTINNGTEGYGAGQFAQNAFFDTWFQGSILQPSVGSYWAGQSNYIYPFSSSDPCCNPSGRPVYAPFRNVRVCFFPKFLYLDMRGASYGGLGLINTSLFGLEIRTPSHENMFLGVGTPATPPVWMTAGGIASPAVGIMENVVTEAQGGADAGFQFFRFTGQGSFTQKSEVIPMPGCNILVPAGQQQDIVVNNVLPITGFGYNSAAPFDTGISATVTGAGGVVLFLCSVGINASSSWGFFAVGRQVGTPTLNVQLISGTNLATFSILGNGNIGIQAPGAGNYAAAAIMNGFK